MSHGARRFPAEMASVGRAVPSFSGAGWSPASPEEEF